MDLWRHLFVFNVYNHELYASGEADNFCTFRIYLKMCWVKQPRTKINRKILN